MPRQTNNCKNENIRIDFFGRLLTFTPDNGRLDIRTMLHALKQAPEGPVMNPKVRLERHRFLVRI
jgi:hypothetical protein